MISHKNQKTCYTQHKSWMSRPSATINLQLSNKSTILYDTRQQKQIFLPSKDFMKRFFNAITITTGLAIFSMFFGAGNLMFPPRVGLLSGQHNFWGLFGFLITGVCLPILGLVSILLFDGDYHAFFKRLGNVPGKIMIAFCMLIIGPIIVMPRIVTLSYVMISPFTPYLSPLLFSIAFLLITFIATMKESKIIDLLGYIISPILLICLGIIIFKGLIVRGPATHSELSAGTLFWSNLKFGYSTLDILAAIFFSSIIIQMLKQKLPKASYHSLALTGLKAGAIGGVLLAIVYSGLSYLGVYHGLGLETVDLGLLFSAISFRVLGQQGAFIIAAAVLMACFSTIIALAAVLAEFLQDDVFKNKISYITGLIMTLVITVIPANMGLQNILDFSRPFIQIMYPAIIVLVICNILYKVFDFKLVKLPVFLTLVLSFLSYYSIL